jgi:hypothetical protein
MRPRGGRKFPDDSFAWLSYVLHMVDKPTMQKRGTAGTAPNEQAQHINPAAIIAVAATCEA